MCYEFVLVSFLILCLGQNEAEDEIIYSSQESLSVIYISTFWLKYLNISVQY